MEMNKSGQEDKYRNISNPENPGMVDAKEKLPPSSELHVEQINKTELKETESDMTDGSAHLQDVKRANNWVNAFIYGSTGVGKSSSVKHIFGIKNEVAVTNKIEAPAITEYVIDVNQDNMGEETSNKTSLHVIDLPGVIDSKGLKQDALNLCSIERFFKENLANSFPNIIFVLINAMDCRYEGPCSTFVKSLKCLERIGLVDTKNPNVIVVMTYANSLTGNEETWKTKFDTKCKNVKRIISEYLKVEANIIALENHLDEEKMENDAGNTKLPDGTWQPKNVHDACLGLLKKNKDDIGSNAFKQVFDCKVKNISIEKTKFFTLEAVQPNFKFLDLITCGEFSKDRSWREKIGTPFENLKTSIPDKASRFKPSLLFEGTRSSSESCLTDGIQKKTGWFSPMDKIRRLKVAKKHLSIKHTDKVQSFGDDNQAEDSNSLSDSKPNAP